MRTTGGRLYRFRSVRSTHLRLMLKSIRKSTKYTTDFSAYLELHNDGKSSARNPIVSIRLPEKVTAAPVGKGWIVEKKREFFETDGRVGIAEFEDHVILPDHSLEFFGMLIPENDYPIGSTVKFEYRIDAEGMDTVEGEFIGET